MAAILPHPAQLGATVPAPREPRKLHFRDPFARWDAKTDIAVVPAGVFLLSLPG